jgi:hypothetical protein
VTQMEVKFATASIGRGAAVRERSQRAARRPHVHRGRRWTSAAPADRDHHLADTQSANRRHDVHRGRQGGREAGGSPCEHPRPHSAPARIVDHRRLQLPHQPDPGRRAPHFYLLSVGHSGSLVADHHGGRHDQPDPGRSVEHDVGRVQRGGDDGPGLQRDSSDDHSGAAGDSGRERER